MNLLSNAFKYNIDNGNIIVTVDKILGSNGPLARIQVADTGTGIKDKNKERIFDRFFQEQHTTEYVGSGIGLHIVKEYVTLHGGEVHLEDNHPQGTIFIVTLPISAEEIIEDIGAEEIPEEETADKNQVTILVVEDNDDFRKFLTSCLKDRYNVLNASDGKSALSVLAKQSVQIVISDVMMPVMDGFELCKKIKNRHSLFSYSGYSVDSAKRRKSCCRRPERRS